MKVYQIWRVDGVLMTYELNFNTKKEERPGIVAFRIDEVDKDDEDSDAEENFAMLARQLKNFLEANQN